MAKTRQNKLDLELLGALLKATPRRTVSHIAIVLGFHDLSALSKALTKSGYRIVNDRRVEKIE